MKRQGRERILALYNKYGILVILIALLAICCMLTSNFYKLSNIVNMLSQMASVTVLTCGITMLIIAGQTDLAGGSVVALTGCVAVGSYKRIMESTGMNVVAAILIAIVIAMLVGMLCNLLVGLVIAKFKAPAFIVTLAMMQAARGAVYLYTTGKPIYSIGEISILGQGKIANVLPYSILIMFLIIVISWFVLMRTRLGRHLYAIGGNEEAAVASGVDRAKTIVKVYLVHGAIVGISGVLFMCRLNCGQPSEAVGLEFDAITAAIIGGASLSGGQGSMFGSLIGAIIIQVITNILQLKFVQSYWQMIITGLIIVLAVILDIVTKGTKK